MTQYIVMLFWVCNVVNIHNLVSDSVTHFMCRLHYDDLVHNF